MKNISVYIERFQLLYNIDLFSIVLIVIVTEQPYVANVLKPTEYLQRCLWGPYRHCEALGKKLSSWQLVPTYPPPLYLPPRIYTYNQEEAVIR